MEPLISKKYRRLLNDSDFSHDLLDEICKVTSDPSTNKEVVLSQKDDTIRVRLIPSTSYSEK